MTVSIKFHLLEKQHFLSFQDIAASRVSIYRQQHLYSFAMFTITECYSFYRQHLHSFAMFTILKGRRGGALSGGEIQRLRRLRHEAHTPSVLVGVSD